MNHSLVYEYSWLVTTIDRSVAEVRHLITRTDKLEENIYKSVGEYLSMNGSNIQNKNRIRYLIKRKIIEAKNRYRTEDAVYLANFNSTDDTGNIMEFEPQDVLANVEQWVIEKESVKKTIDLLAKDDRRKNLILTEWANGETNDTELSHTLARVLGGNARSHCRYIQRFRIECQRELATAI